MTISKVCAALAATTALSAGAGEATEAADFDALTVIRSGAFELDITPRDALLLFTAPGERLWIREWDPLILNGDGFARGTVFLTTSHEHVTYWVVSDFDRERRHAKYIRVTPESDMGTVDVTVTANESGGSTVNVTYQLTGLTPAGNQKLQESFSRSDYATMMQRWKCMIQDSRARIDEYFRDSGR